MAGAKDDQRIACQNAADVILKGSFTLRRKRGVFALVLAI